MRALGLFLHRAEVVYHVGKLENDLSDLQKEWVLGVPANQEKFQMTPGFNRKFSKPANLQASDFSKSCFCVFNFVGTQTERLNMWMNVGTLLFCNTKENVDLNQYPFEQDLAKLHKQIVQDASDEAVSRKLRCVLHLLDNGDVAQAIAYMHGELKAIEERKKNQSIKK